MAHARVETFAPANAGWYLPIDFNQNYPCGLRDIDIGELEIELAYSSTVIFSAGTQDTDASDPSYDCGDAQGDNRYERALWNYVHTATDAQNKGYDYNWSLVEVPGVGHDSDGMTPANADAVFGTTTLLPVDDAYVQSNYPSTNYGDSTSLRVDGSSHKVSYMKFDLSNVQNVTSATLAVMISEPSAATQIVTEVTDNSWSEDSITYNNRPTLGQLITTINGADTDNEWLFIDLTDYIQSHEDHVVSMAFDSADRDGLYFRSKEHDSTARLILDMENTPSECPDGSLPDPECDETDPSPPFITILNPTDDAYVKPHNPKKNYGDDPVWRVDGRSKKTAYAQFDLSSIDAVSSAILRVRVESGSDALQTLREVTDNNWDENTLTWNNRPLGSAQIATMNGGDRGDWIKVDITDYVITQMGGLMSFLIEQENSDGLTLYSMDAESDWPELVITH